MAERSRRMQNFEVSSSNGDDDLRPAIRYRSSLVRRNLPPKTTLAAILLLVFGIIFLCIGANILWNHLIYNGKDKGLAILLLGGISKIETVQCYHYFFLDLTIPMAIMLCVQCFSQVVTRRLYFSERGEDGKDLTTRKCLPTTTSVRIICSYLEIPFNKYLQVLVYHI
jgi:hypothetical protein